LEVQVDDIVYDSGGFSVRGAQQRSVTLAEVAEAVTDPTSEFERTVLETTVVYTPPNFTYPFGTHVAVVEIEPRTGEVHLDRYIAVDDVGSRLNPELVEGQVVGGVVQGLGEALTEEAVYDDTGNLLTTTFKDYAVPKATQVPNIETDFTETPSPHTPHGAKGAGEVGAVAAPAAVANAVVDALKPFDVSELELPIRAENIWKVTSSDSF
jgi:carbon-monoxide dehydrogenase large subunit